MLELPEVREIAGPFDEAGLVHPWRHADPRVDALCDEVQTLVHRGEKNGHSRARIFSEIWQAASADAGRAAPAPVLRSRSAIPYLEEPWYC